MVPRERQRKFQLEELVAEILGTFDGERLELPVENESIDYKEEAGRRLGKKVLPGRTENAGAAQALADVVACFANTPGGGVLLLGIEDGSGRVIGTELDEGWLVERIGALVGVSPDIVAHRVAQKRVLAIYVAQSDRPRVDTAGNLRWRVKDSCVHIEYSSWRGRFEGPLD